LSYRRSLGRGTVGRRRSAALAQMARTDSAKRPSVILSPPPQAGSCQLGKPILRRNGFCPPRRPALRIHPIIYHGLTSGLPEFSPGRHVQCILQCGPQVLSGGNPNHSDQLIRYRPLKLGLAVQPTRESIKPPGSRPIHGGVDQLITERSDER